MNKTSVEKIVNEYCKEKGLSIKDKKEYSLYPLYIHLNGFSHSIGFTNHKANGEYVSNYNSVGYSNYMSECEQKCWGAENEYQEELATRIFKGVAHYCYQNNAKEILF